MAKKPWIRTLQPTAKESGKAKYLLPEMNFPQLLQAYHYSFKSLEEAAQLAAYLSSFYPDFHQSRIELGLNELFLNAIEHGNLGIDYALKSELKGVNAWEREISKRLQEPAHREKSVDVCLEINQDYILLRIKDQGDGFDWREFNSSHPFSTNLHGRGLIMVQQICFDKVEFSEKGNEVTCLIYTGMDNRTPVR